MQLKIKIQKALIKLKETNPELFYITGQERARSIEDFGLKGPAADFCCNLKWSYWRYPWGIDDVKRYASHPAAPRDEQPKNITD